VKMLQKEMIQQSLVIMKLKKHFGVDE
jgi:hypothetical protein